MWYNNLFNIYLFAGEIGKSTKKKLAKFKNAITFQTVFDEKMQDALTRYDITGLPDTVSKRVILESLLWYGCVCFFEREGSILALPCCPTGDGFNIYGDVGQVWVYGRNGMFDKTVDTYIRGSDVDAFLEKTNGIGTKSNLRGVVVWENATHYPFIEKTMLYSQAISDSMRTLDVCRMNLKQPYVIASEESAIKTVKEFFARRDNNEEFINIIDTGIFPANKVQVLPLVTDGATLDAVTSLIEWYDNKYRELCGIQNNSQIDKKGENLIREEVTVNDMYTDLSLDKVIPYLQSGLDDANRIFGLSMKAVRITGTNTREGAEGNGEA